MSISLTPDGEPHTVPDCPACDVAMNTAHKGHALVLYVCPCCGGALTVPPTKLPVDIPPVPLQKA